MSRSRMVVQGLAVAVVGIVVALGMMELAVRWIAPQPLQHIRLDDELYFVNRPRARFVYARGGEYRVDVRYNDWGFRGPVPAPHAAPGTTRIVLVGASQTEGLQVREDEVYGVILQHELERLLPGRRFEVVNLGVSAYGTHQVALLLHRYGPRVNPDWVVLGFSPSFEIADNATLPLATMDEHGVHLVPHHFSFWHRRFLGTKVWLGSTSQLYVLWTSRVKALSQQFLARRGVIEATGPAGAAQHADAAGALFRSGPLPPETLHDMAFTEGLIELVRDEACGLGAGFAVLTIPDKLQVDPRLADRSLDDLGRPEREFASRFERDRILHMEALPDLRRAQAGGVRTYFVQDGHLDAAGHRVVGQALARWLAGYLERPVGTPPGCAAR